MESNQNNILKLLLQMGQHPERGQAALRILDQSSAGLEKSAKAMSEHTAEVLKATRAQQESLAVFSQVHNQSEAATVQANQHYVPFLTMSSN